jgi:hypothetical protein
MSANPTLKAQANKTELQHSDSKVDVALLPSGIVCCLLLLPFYSKYQHKITKGWLV